jgi:hypothetical protein
MNTTTTRIFHRLAASTRHSLLAICFLYGVAQKSLSVFQTNPAIADNFAQLRRQLTGGMEITKAVVETKPGQLL